MTKAQSIEIGSAELAVLINRSVRTARRYMVKLPNARKVAGKWTVTLSVAEVRKLRAYAIDLARFVAKEARDMQAGTDVCDLQEMLDRSESILHIVKTDELVPVCKALVTRRQPNGLENTANRMIAA